MSEQGQLPSPESLRKTALKAAAAASSAAVKAGGADTRGGVHFVAVPEPSENHLQLVLDAFEQMLASGAEGLVIEPGAQTCRLMLLSSNGGTEPGQIPLSAGRCAIEVIRRQMSSFGADDSFAGFGGGILRIESREAEHRFRVHLIPTAHGPSASIRRLLSLPAGSGDLAEMGLTPAQAAMMDTALGSGGLLLIGGPDLEWVGHSCSILLARAAARGGRTALLSSEPGVDMAGVGRVEVGCREEDQLKAVQRLAAAGFNCIGLDQIGSAAMAQAYGAAAFRYRCTIVVPIEARSAAQAVERFQAHQLAPQHAATVALATCQVQLPLLCPACARWGEAARDDLRFFEIETGGKADFYIRAGCPRCNGQVVDFGRVFEVLPISETLQKSLHTGVPLSRLQDALLSVPGYMPLLKNIVAAAREGRCSLSEARQYWQIQIGTPSSHGLPIH